MPQVLHLIDDTGLGGVTRVLADHLPRLAGRFSHQVLTVGANWRLPPRISADIVVVHFTLSWAKLPFLLALRLRAPRARLVLVEHSYTASYDSNACAIARASAHCCASAIGWRIALSRCRTARQTGCGRPGW
jgi:hypothetical protein